MKKKVFLVIIIFALASASFLAFDYQKKYNRHGEKIDYTVAHKDRVARTITNRYWGKFNNNQWTCLTVNEEKLLQEMIENGLNETIQDLVDFSESTLVLVSGHRPVLLDMYETEDEITIYYEVDKEAGSHLKMLPVYEDPIKYLTVRKTQKEIICQNVDELSLFF